MKRKTRLYLEYEKKYLEEESKRIEEHRNGRITEIKNIFRPLTKEELDEHTKKYDQLIKAKRQEYKNKLGGLNQSRNYESSDNAGVSGSGLAYKSKFHEILRQEDIEFKE